MGFSLWDGRGWDLESRASQKMVPTVKRQEQETRNVREVGGLGATAASFPSRDVGKEGRHGANQGCLTVQ